MNDPKLQIPCEVYSRTVGYFRPVSNWNRAKKCEFKERVTLDRDKYKKLCGVSNESCSN